MRLARIAAATVVGATVAVGALASPASAGGYWRTQTNLNLRNCQWTNDSRCSVILVIPSGRQVYLNCWAYGTSVNGNNIWYNAFYGGANGMLAGDYVDTGRDPNPAIGRCP